MQDIAASAERLIVQPLPEMGQNKILQAVADYDLMVSDLASTKKSLSEYVDIANKLQAENDALKAQCKLQTDFLKDQVNIITDHRDRLQTTLKGIMTRYKVIRECFAKCEEEGLKEGLGIEPRPLPTVPGGAIGALPPPSLSS